MITQVIKTMNECPKEVYVKLDKEETSPKLIFVTIRDRITQIHYLPKISLVEWLKYLVLTLEDISEKKNPTKSETISISSHYMNKLGIHI